VASQRLTIAKLAGLSGELAFERLTAWAAARNANDPDEWSPEQWPESVRRQVDEFAEQLRAHGLELPVCYFAEWSDLWSMGDVFIRGLSPANSPPPIMLLGDRYEILAYALPDEGRLSRHLASAGPQQFREYDSYVSRLREALDAWNSVVPQSTLIVLRHVVGGLVEDHEVTESLKMRPDWLR
jgi:hypothetical protein